MDKSRNALMSALSVMGQFTPEEYESAYRSKRTPGHELLAPGEAAAAFRRALDEGWAAIAQEGVEPHA